MDPLARPCEAPVHGEGERGPVCLDDSGQGRDAILAPVGRPANPKVPARRGAKNALDMESDNSVAEQRHRNLLGFRARLGADVDGVSPRFSVPDGIKGAGTEHFPTMSVCDVKRQATIGEGVQRIIHPPPHCRRPPDQRRPPRMEVADQVHSASPGMLCNSPVNL